MAKIFEHVYTIEIQLDIYNAALNKKNELKLNNVSIYLGDSSKVLPDIIKSINVPIIFYLDGHWSRGNTGRGDKDVPLLEELTAIDSRNHHDIIIIDDFRLFETTQWENWKDISLANIRNCFKNKKIVTEFSIDDRYVICT
jgi:archaellum biogenesis ATPase FlaH